MHRLSFFLLENGIIFLFLSAKHGKSAVQEDSADCKKVSQTHYFWLKHSNACNILAFFTSNMKSMNCNDDISP